MTLEISRRLLVTAAVLAAMAVAPPVRAAVLVQCGPPGAHLDPDGDAVPDPSNPLSAGVRCMHLTAGDGFIRMADGRVLYTFGFNDVTGTPPDQVGMDPTAANFAAPTIELSEAQDFYLTLTNVGMTMRPDLFDPHTVHFHGKANAAPVFDGMPEGSFGVNMGSSFTYYYAHPEPGTYMYHCHQEATEHMQMGMLGNLYIMPAQDGNTTYYASGKYVYQGTSLQRGRLREYGVFGQDSWRVRQNMTLNLGVRYDITATELERHNARGILGAIDVTVLYLTLKLCGLQRSDITLIPIAPFAAFLLLHLVVWMALPIIFTRAPSGGCHRGRDLGSRVATQLSPSALSSLASRRGRLARGRSRWCYRRPRRRQSRGRERGPRRCGHRLFARSAPKHQRKPRAHQHDRDNHGCDGRHQHALARRRLVRSRAPALRRVARRPRRQVELGRRFRRRVDRAVGWANAHNPLEKVVRSHRYKRL